MMTLYSCAGSRGLRVTWSLCELDMQDAVTLKMMRFPPRAHDKSYFAVNPLGTVPALDIDGYVMTESSAIAAYLAGRFGAGTLAVAADEADYTAYLDYLHHADATLTFPQTVALRFCMFEQERGLQAAGEAYADWFGKRLAKVDARLADRDFLCADRFTAADIAVGYALHLTPMTRLDHLLTPRLAAWVDQLRTRDGFRRAVAWESETGIGPGIG